MIWLKYFRVKRGLSQKQIADIAGVQENTVWRWESGRATPSVDTAEIVARGLGITTVELVNGPRLKITIDLKGAEDMTNEMVAVEGVFFGYRASDDSYVFRGAIPAEGETEESVINVTVNEFRRQLEAAFAGREKYKLVPCSSSH